MLMVRWSSEAARKLYARLAESTQCSLQSAAADASFDSIRAHTLVEAATSSVTDTAIAESAAALQAAANLVDAVTVRNAGVASSADLKRVCAIDDDDTFAAVMAASDALEGLAAKADSAFIDSTAHEPESDSEDDA